MKLTTAILAELQNGPRSEAELSRTTNRKRLGDTLHRLCRAGEIRDENGAYSVVAKNLVFFDALRLPCTER